MSPSRHIIRCKPVFVWFENSRDLAGPPWEGSEARADANACLPARLGFQFNTWCRHRTEERFTWIPPGGKGKPGVTQNSCVKVQCANKIGGSCYSLCADQPPDTTNPHLLGGFEIHAGNTIIDPLLCERPSVPHKEHEPQDRSPGTAFTRLTKYERVAIGPTKPRKHRQHNGNTGPTNNHYPSSALGYPDGKAALCT